MPKVIASIKEKVNKYIDKKNAYLKKQYKEEDFTGKFIINMIYKKNQRGGAFFASETKSVDEIDVDEDKEVLGFLGAIELADNITNIYSDKVGECAILNKRNHELYKFKNVGISNSALVPAIDTKSYDNCCNLFTFAVYYKEMPLGSLDLLLKHLEIINQSIENIKHSGLFTDWIMRLYIDSSVIKKLKNIKIHDISQFSDVLDKITLIFDKLFYDKIVEIYIVLDCNVSYDLSYFESFKSLPLIEKNVNYVIIAPQMIIIDHLYCIKLLNTLLNPKVLYSLELGVFKVSIYPHAYKDAFANNNRTFLRDLFVP